MASCQKYFSIISDSSQTHTMCLLQVSHWRSRSHRLSQKEMNEPSQLSHFLEAHKKNEPQPHCYGEEERGVCREKWFCCCRCLGGREPFFGKHVFSRHSEAVYLVSCYHCHLQPNCQMGLPGHRDTAVFSTLPFYFLSSLATSDRHKTRVPFLPLTAKLEEKAPSTLHGQLWSKPTC